MKNPLRGKALLTAAVALAALLAYLLWAGLRGPEPVALALDQAYELNAVTRIAATGEGIEVEMRNQDAHFSVPLGGRIENAKLRLDFARLENVAAVQVFYAKDGHHYSDKRQIRLPFPKHHPLVFDFPLPDGDYQSLRLDFDLTDDTGRAVIARAVVMPRSPADAALAPYLLALLLITLTLVPGTLVYGLCAREGTSREAFLATVAGTVALFFVAAYLLLFAIDAAGLHEVRGLFTGAFVLLLAVPTFVLARRRRLGMALNALRIARPELALYVLVVLVCTFIVSHDTELPLTNLSYESVSGPKTYDAFRAHDNYFQYANGSAIARDLPFKTWYRGGRLLYQPQDRTMLPGVMYGVVQRLFSEFSVPVGRSFLTYTLFAICLNALILLPLAVLARRLAPAAPWAPLLVAMSLNAFVLVNYYFAWFKFAGAALFLGAVAVLLMDHRRLRSWALAGLLFGLSANMHAGNALGIPLIFLWFAWRAMRGADLGWLRGLLGPAVLCLVFVAANLPWGVVKHVYMPDNQALLKSFFLAGKDDPRGLLASAQLFFREIPPEQQIAWRANRLVDAFHFQDFADFAHLLRHGEWRELALRWNKEEFSRFAFVVYPSLGFLLLAWLTHKTGLTPAPRNRLAPEAPVLAVLGFASVLVIILGAYGRSPPDVNHAQSMGLVLLIHLILVGAVLQSNALVRRLYWGYLAVAAVRLGAFL
jgi:hypothetical protein